MAIRDRDRAVHRDALTLLAGLPGRAARDLESQHAAILDEKNMSRRPVDTADSNDRGALAEESRRLMKIVLQDLAKLAATVPSNVLLSVPLLLGQADFRERLIGPGPNRFDFEVALLRSYASAPVGEFDETAIAATFRCLALARKVLLLRPTIMLMGEEESALGNSLMVAGLLERGRFSGHYDYQVAERIEQRLRSRGCSVDSPRALRRILETFLPAWSRICFDFYQACRVAQSQLSSWLEERDLLTQPLWNDNDLRLIGDHAPSMWLPAAAFVGDPECVNWLEALQVSLPVAVAPRKEFDLAQLAGEPIVAVDGRVLLIQPHRFDTDISDVINGVWGPVFGETYHAVRGDVVEEIAYTTLMRLPGAVGIPNGHYTSSSGRLNGESDGVVLWEGHLFIIEAKGGFLSTAARRGNGEAAIWDIRSTIGEAFYQASRLLQVLEEDSRVTLAATSGERLELDTANVQRAHIVVATADDFGNVAVLHDDLEEAGILPRGGRPLVAAGQELMLLYDIFADPLDLVAYLLFREEVLTFRPTIRVADEQEVLGGYVAGVDFIAVSQKAMRQSPGEVGNLVPDPVLQRHIDHWLQARFEDMAKVDEAARDVPPPMRHYPAAYSLARTLFERGDLASALTVLQAGRQAADDAPRLVAPHVGKVAQFSSDAEIAVVTTFTEVPTRVLRHEKGWKAATRARQIWAFKRYGQATPLLYRATKTNGPIPDAHGFLPTIARADLSLWYERVDAKRRRGFDDAVVIALEQEGLAPTTAIGVCRLGLVQQVRAAASHGADIQKAAALWMDTLKAIAQSRGVESADLPVDALHVAQALNLLQQHAIRKDQLRVVLEAAIDHQLPPVEYVMKKMPAESTSDRRTPHVREILAEVIRAEESAARRAADGEEKAKRYLVGQVMRRATSNRPSPEEVGVALTEFLAREWPTSRSYQSGAQRPTRD